MNSEEKLQAEARSLWEQGVECQEAEDLKAAEALYRQSLLLHATAEAHTFLGYVLARRGDVSGAIAECERAIVVDPTFGNPYNDIGAYLIQQRKFDEAVPWLERAKSAPRYEPRHFPYLNLARVYEEQGQIVGALRELVAAQKLQPADAGISDKIGELRRFS